MGGLASCNHLSDYPMSDVSEFVSDIYNFRAKFKKLRFT